MNFITQCRNQNVLLLQGPMGPFFRRLADDLIDHGANVFKINFNGGDFLFYWRSAKSYRGDIADWPDFLNDFIDKHQITKIILFGDCRIYHQNAIKISKIKGIEVLVFEEGYYRPNYITLEKGGVNSHSSLSRNPEFYRGLNPEPISASSDVGSYFFYTALYSYLYYLFSILFGLFFLNYQHHRNLKFTELFYWVRSYLRKIKHHFLERNFFKEFIVPNKGNIFLVPLQVNTDSQVLFHSHYASNKDFIRQVVLSFKNNAPINTILVFKHHPLDRAYHDYQSFISKESLRAGVSKKVFYVFEERLPKLFPYVRGIVVINSTSGLAGIDHQIPVKACGSAIYSINGIKFLGTLDNFWKKAHLFKMDLELYARFKEYVIAQTQLNGSFYKRIKGSELKSGLMF